MKSVGARTMGALLIAAAVGGMGCAPCVTGSSSTTVCEASGEGHVSGPVGLKLQPSLVVSGGDCAPSSCKNGGSVAFQRYQGSTAALHGHISFDRITGTPPITLDLKNLGAGSASFWVDGPSSTLELELESGTMVLTSLSSSGFTATISATLRTPSGNPIVVSDTTARIAGCHEDEMCSY